MTKLAIVAVASLLVFVVPMRALKASCDAPKTAVIFSIEVKGCVPFDPRRDAAMRQRIERFADDPQRTRSLMQSYRGAMVDANMGERKTVPMSRLKHGYDAVAYLLKDGRVFAPGRDDVCEQFKVGSQVRIYGADPCCDGDPGMPCLFDRAPQ